MTWTRAEASRELHQCSAGKHWITTPTCDSCAMNEHRCPPTLEEAGKLVHEAGELHRRAKELEARLRGV